MGKLQHDIDNRRRDLEINTANVESTLNSLRRSKGFWRATEDEATKELRRRYSDDPGVKQLNQELNPFIIFQNISRVLLGFVILALVGYLISTAVRGYRGYILSQTPSPTITPSLTLTPSPTLTQTPTNTSTPSPTATSTTTPLPTTMVASKELLAKEGCYATYRSYGAIPAGAVVEVFSTEIVKDELKRECIQVKYTTDKGTTIFGWVLLAELQP